MARTPRIRHLRHRDFDRARHSSRFLAWLDAQADRLAKTAKEVFALLVGSSAQEVEALASASEPANTVLPTITGTAQVGVELSASTGTWTGNPTPTYTYQWLADATEIDGATDSTYTPVEGDLGKALTITVTGTNSEGSDSATSAATDAVIAAE